jgi:hypothetical protein
MLGLLLFGLGLAENPACPICKDTLPYARVVYLLWGRNYDQGKALLTGYCQKGYKGDEQKMCIEHMANHYQGLAEAFETSYPEERLCKDICHACDGFTVMKAADEELMKEDLDTLWSMCISERDQGATLLRDRGVPERHIKVLQGLVQAGARKTFGWYLVTRARNQ